MLTCAATPSALSPTYRWFYKSNVLNGITGSTLRIISAAGTDSGNYYCEVDWQAVGTFDTPEYVMYVREVVTTSTLFFIGSDTVSETLICTAYGDAVSGVMFSNLATEDLSADMTVTLTSSAYSHVATLVYTNDYQTDDEVVCTFSYTALNTAISGQTIILPYIEGIVLFL